jgi:NAD(P)H-dependent flavin oxidoreductase YrpB (nitropropane dioxygenase family)
LLEPQRVQDPMPLRTRLCDLLEIEVPIVLAGMGGASTPELAAAVSNAGGLGVLGAAACGPNRLREWIERTRKLTSKPFGVDTLLPASVRREGAKPSSGPTPQQRLPEYQKFAREFMQREGLVAASAEEIAREIDPLDRGGPLPLSKDFFEAQMQVVIDERVPVYAAGLGNPGPYIEALHRNGTVVLAVVGQTHHARQVARSGVDAIVAQGHDGGGHNAPVGTLALIPQVRDAIGDLPLLGAGGIADGRGVAAALTLGADGVWIGTAFLATREAGLRDFQKQQLVDATDASTTISRCVTGKPARMLRTKWSQAFEDGSLSALPMPYQSIVAMPVMGAAMRAQRGDIAVNFAGQGLGLIHEVKGAAEVLHDLVSGTERALLEAPRSALR